MNGTTSKNIAPYVVSVVVTMFLVILAYATFFVPKMNESRTLVDATATARTNNVALTAKAEKLDAISQNLAPLKAQVQDFTASFPSSAEQQAMIDAINEAASSTGVSLTTLNPNVPAPAKEDSDSDAPAAPAASQGTQVGTELPGPAPVAAAADGQAPAEQSAQLGTVSLKIDGTGSFEAVQAFILKIENLKRPVLVHELQVEKLDNGYHVMINGETFLTAPLVEPGKTAAGATEGSATEPK